MRRSLQPWAFKPREQPEFNAAEFKMVSPWHPAIHAPYKAYRIPNASSTVAAERLFVLPLVDGDE